MNIQWKNLMLKITFWLLVEVSLNLIGIDELADYSEFLFMPKFVVQLNHQLAG